MKNSRETFYGKGDNRRPEDRKKFGENYDKIFGEKKVRKERNDVRAQKRGGSDRN